MNCHLTSVCCVHHLGSHALARFHRIPLERASLKLGMVFRWNVYYSGIVQSPPEPLRGSRSNFYRKCNTFRRYYCSLCSSLIPNVLMCSQYIPLTTFSMYINIILRHRHKFQDLLALPVKQVLKITCPNRNVTFPKINNQNLKKYTDKINRNTILFIHSYGKHFESFLSISIFFLNPFLIFINHFLIFINDCIYKY